MLVASVRLYMTATRSTVLVADDQASRVDRYAASLPDDYAVRRAYSGREAFDRIDDYVDVTLLARRMAGLTGDEVLERLRSWGYSCQVALLADIEPRVDILQLGVDDYLRTPVTESDLRDTVARLSRRVEYDEEIQRLCSLASRAATLEAAHDRDTLQACPEYRTHRAQLEKLRHDLDDRIRNLPPEERAAIPDIHG